MLENVDVDACVDVTLVTAIWDETSVFGGMIEITVHQGRSARYAFRAEARGREYTFTDLERTDGEADESCLESPLALEMLAFTLDGTVGLLRARELKRSQEEQDPAAEPCDLDDLGFQVRFPITSTEPEVVAALLALTGSKAPVERAMALA
jgi:hypothetical protein